ncbi:hypothetical protein DFH09DRAFT_1184091 [Mycena vulgaris]|nr:hypothetical protein DFH09DRAFT_1184091 [Mycena vulgaris]
MMKRYSAYIQFGYQGKLCFCDRPGILCQLLLPTQRPKTCILAVYLQYPSASQSKPAQHTPEWLHGSSRRLQGMVYTPCLSSPLSLQMLGSRQSSPLNMSRRSPVSIQARCSSGSLPETLSKRATINKEVVRSCMGEVCNEGLCSLGSPLYIYD